MNYTVVVEKTDAKRDVTIRDALDARASLMVIGIFIVAVIAAYQPALVFWWREWFKAESYYSHGPFVVAGSAFVAWCSRRRVAQETVKPLWIGHAVMFIAASIGWIAWMGASASVMGFTLPVYLAGAVLAIFGTRMLYIVAISLTYLYFTAVLPESILIALSYKAQLLSTKSAAACLDLFGLQAVARGAFIELPGLTVEIASACSGFRLMISMCAIAAFLAYIRSGPLWGKAALIILSFPVAFAVNTGRIALVTLTGSIWGQEALKRTHDITGYAVLLVGAALLLLTARVLKCGNYRKMPL